MLGQVERLVVFVGLSSLLHVSMLAGLRRRLSDLLPPRICGLHGDLSTLLRS